ncbi:MAG TPA: class I SAM-dependent methyltransferase [bacterium]|nr:class I SAM-dependent methyltransferase [bacterium]
MADDAKQAHSHSHKHGHHHGHGHGTGLKFDPSRLERLRDPARLEVQNPDVLWGVVSAGLKVQTVVDLGAGIGFFALPIARHLPQGTVYACDVNADMLRYLEEAIRQAGATNVKPVKTEEVHVPLADGIADVVLMVNLHHELDFRDRTLAECKRLLRPGGRLALVDWKAVETEHGPPLEVRFTTEQVEAELEAAGFHDIAEHAIMPNHWCLTALK